ncbi:MAG: sensor histidine kinase [Anaerolineales bacterium]
MFRSLRNRLVLSHILPVLITIPIIGIGLIYILETQILLPDLTRGMTSEAALISEIISENPSLLENPDQALNALGNFRNPNTRLMLLTSEGQIIASSEPADANRLGEKLQIPDAPALILGEITSQTNLSQRMQGEIIDIYVPVLAETSSLIGIVRVSYRYTSLNQVFARYRYLLLLVLAFGSLLGVGFGLLLALSINQPISRAVQAVFDIAQGETGNLLPEQGPAELNMLSQAVNHLTTRLEELESTRQQLLKNLIHEIGRPLGALRSGIQAMQKGAQEDPRLAQDLLAGMDHETRVLQHLLDDLAQLHDQLLGPLELNKEPLDLKDWLPAVLASWAQAARQKEIEWRVTISPDLPIIHADAVRLSQAIGNLISNALRYTPQHGSVSLNAGLLPDSVFIDIQDTGPGITPENLEKILTPFYRGAQSNRFPKGMGLGLSITAEIIRAHDGRLEIESQPGQGSRFRIILPN